MTIAFYEDLERESVKAKDNHKRLKFHRIKQKASFLGADVLCKCPSKMSEIEQHQLSNELLREHMAY